MAQGDGGDRRASNLRVERVDVDDPRFRGTRRERYDKRETDARNEAAPGGHARLSASGAV
jgi:hypothetical protein